MWVGTMHGAWLTFPRYCLPGIKLDGGGVLFAVYEGSDLKMVETDIHGEFRAARCAHHATTSLGDAEGVRSAYAASTVAVPRGAYDVQDFAHVDAFIPEDALAARVLFTIWFGKKLSDNRQDQLRSIMTRSACRVVHLHEGNVHMLRHPLHPRFDCLSSVHKADYLRCYLMHHHGGGYSDLKKTSGSWVPCFDALAREDALWAIGHDCDGVAFPSNTPRVQVDRRECSHELEARLRAAESQLIGVAFFVFKRGTPLTRAWFRELHRRLDAHGDALRLHPARADRESKDGTPWPWWEGGSVSRTRYPLCWNRILGQILYPLQLQHLARVRKGVPHRADHGHYQ